MWKSSKSKRTYEGNATGKIPDKHFTRLLAEYDARVKKSLAHVFGEENDFDSILSGANVMAVASNGELVITNFLDAMRPIVEDGVKTYAKMEAQKAVQEARNK